MLSLAFIGLGAALTLAACHGLGVLWLRSQDAPCAIRLAIGATLLSLAVFGLLAAGVASPWALIGLACVACLGNAEAQRRREKPIPWSWAAVLMAPFAVYYAVNALAPEVQPDAAGYHLGLVAQYLRLHGFSPRIAFYEIAPQGMEMLYLIAFAVGKHSAAKLVHFAFLLATVPLMVRVGQRLGISPIAAWFAAALYFCSPVVGVSGTSAYTDAAGVSFALASFYLFDSHPGAAGLAAGFCYAIKFPGAAVVVLGLLLASNRLRFAAGAVICIAPWVLRALILTGNPVAPLANGIFSNPWFHSILEYPYPPVPWWRIPGELFAGGAFQGLIGPALFLAPLGLLALRYRAGRICWLAAAILAAPWLANHGARFLMPAMPFVCFAIAMVLPARLTAACAAAAAIACWPAVLARYTPPHIWRLDEFPARAALRLQPESDYLWNHIEEYKIARMTMDSSPPGAHIFAFMAVSRAYVDRDVLEYWHSAEADRLTFALREAAAGVSRYELEAAWPAQPLTAIRFRVDHPQAQHCLFAETRLYHGDDLVYNSPQWTVRAWPSRWEAPLAFDGNPATVWRSWSPQRPGMYVEADFDRPQVLTGVRLTAGALASIYGAGVDGKWRLLAAAPQARVVREDLRLAALRAVRRAGFDYLLVPGGPFETWPGVDLAGEAGKVRLLRLK